MYVCMYVTSSVRFKTRIDSLQVSLQGSLMVGSGQVGSGRFKVQGMTDTMWITYNLTSPAAGSCCYLPLILLPSLPTCFTAEADLALFVEQGTSYCETSASKLR